MYPSVADYSIMYNDNNNRCNNSSSEFIWRFVKHPGGITPPGSVGTFTNWSHTPFSGRISFQISSLTTSGRCQSGYYFRQLCYSSSAHILPLCWFSVFHVPSSFSFRPIPDISVDCNLIFNIPIISWIIGYGWLLYLPLLFHHVERWKIV